MEIQARLIDALGQAAVATWDSIDHELQRQIESALALSGTSSDAKESLPACLVSPGTTVALGQVMALAAENGWRVLPMGAGSKLGWGGLAKGADIALSTARLNRVMEHAVGDFTVTVESGMRFADLQALLAEQRQFLAVDPAFAATATVGGIVATADAGSLRQRYGGLRDMLIGVQFVRYDGEVARAGGRVVKNVAGYDLMKLMTGAYGSLGILSELTFRLYPVQAASRTIVLSGSVQAVAQAIAEVRMSGLTPIALDLTLADTAAALMAGLTPSAPTSHMALIARFQGISAGVEEQTERLQKVGKFHSLDYQQLEGEADTAFWRRVSGLIEPHTVLCKVGMRPSALPALLTLLEKFAASGCEGLAHSSSGLGWVQWKRGEGIETLKAEIEEVRSHCQNNGGFLTVLQAPVALKQSMDVWGYRGTALKVMGDIKAKFDPQRLLSPGRFVGGL
ncbi:MAG: FAD-binding oxidoreductase [Cyanobacteria bacterium J06623_5]